MIQHHFLTCIQIRKIKINILKTIVTTTTAKSYVTLQLLTFTCKIIQKVRLYKTRVIIIATETN